MAENSSCALFMILYSGIYNKEPYLKEILLRNSLIKDCHRKMLDCEGNISHFTTFSLRIRPLTKFSCNTEVKLYGGQNFQSLQ